ncbi:MAG: hypothetical protein ACRDLR_02525, partial [Gaiellaceae bacterium]
MIDSNACTCLNGHCFSMPGDPYACAYCTETDGPCPVEVDVARRLADVDEPVEAGRRHGATVRP